MIHIAEGALGISALLAASAPAFNIVKYAGAAYRLYLGIRTLFFSDNRSGKTVLEEESENLNRTFYEGV